MSSKRKIPFIQVCFYLFFGVSALFLYYIGDNGEPFSLALAYGMCSAGLSPLLSAVIGFFPCALSLDPLLCLLYLFQSILLWVAFFLQDKFRKRNGRKSILIPTFAFLACMVCFTFGAPFSPYALPFSFSGNNAIMQKAILSALIFLSACAFSVALKSILHKLLKCKLRVEEIIFCLLFFVLIGVGICRFLGVNAYTGIAVLILLLFSCATKDASALLCSFTLSLPPLLTFGISIEKFFLYGIACVLFVKTGRLATACALLICFFSYGYFEGLYLYPTPQLIQALLSLLLPTLFFVLIPTPFIREMENRLIFYREKHLSRIAINRNRALVGEKLFEISAVFREIQNAFTALDSKEADENAKAYLRGCLIDEVCNRCPNKNFCARNNAFAELEKLIEISCQKGKGSLIDLPRALSENCINQSGLLYALNKRVEEYKNFKLQTDNASEGRVLLAKQALGVSEILKNLALEQSEPLRLYTDKERAFSSALLRVGIVSSEVLVYGDEDNLTLSLVVFGNADVKKIASVATHQFQQTMMISEKLSLSQDRFCCILRKKPYFDGAFGVSCRKKEGRTVCGDSYSVVKIDERKFMVVLSDGMGSGEYAQRVSECTVSLLESFYRAKMPSELVLSTVNKLLTFSKEERFVCTDIAVVDLDDGNADVIKIGSPTGFILSGNTIKVLETSSLPLGILDAVRPDACSYHLAENDVLLFLSDGITDAFGSVSDLYEILRGIPYHNPQQLTDTLLENALQIYGGKAKDDMTAVAVRLFRTPSE